MKNPLRIIPIMSTMKALNLSVYSMMRKRDFKNRDTDNYCQKRTSGIPFCLKKGGSNPIRGSFGAVFAHSILGG